MHSLPLLLIAVAGVSAMKAAEGEGLGHSSKSHPHPHHSFHYNGKIPHRKPHPRERFQSNEKKSSDGKRFSNKYLPPPPNFQSDTDQNHGEPASKSRVQQNFPSEADTLAYVDALKHSDLSEWRSLEEVAARAGGGSCSGAVTTSVLTALYLLGLFNLCAASPVSCCMPPVATKRKRRNIYNTSTNSSRDPRTFFNSLNNLQQNLTKLSMKEFRDLPHVTTPDGGRVPVHVSVVEQVRKLWDSNPRLLSSVTCQSATESVRSSFISLSGVASGIILAYSVAQLSQCYPDVSSDVGKPPKVWFFDIPKPPPEYLPPEKEYPIPSLPGIIPVPGKNEDDDGCDRNEVPLESGLCAPLLSPTHCPYHHWILLNRNTMKGECVPRLCSEGQVYVEKDEMCHYITEEGLCPRNQRLFVTAVGTAVCDCPDGMFQGPYGQCYHLYENAYCSKGLVLQFHKPSQSLTCQPDPCGHVNANLWQDDLPYAPSNDGYCYQFNANQPCGKGKRFGFDTDLLEAGCVSMEDAGLVRPRRSYMYHHMSFPSHQDQEFPHYQVSYVILNGTTWGLEVKGVGRDKRSTESNSQSKEVKVDFIDTRDMPKKIKEIFLPELKIRNRTINFKRRRRKILQQLKKMHMNRKKQQRKIPRSKKYLNSQGSIEINKDNILEKILSTTADNIINMHSTEKTTRDDSKSSNNLKNNLGDINKLEIIKVDQTHSQENTNNPIKQLFKRNMNLDIEKVEQASSNSHTVQNVDEKPKVKNSNDISAGKKKEIDIKNSSTNIEAKRKIEKSRLKKLISQFKVEPIDEKINEVSKKLSLTKEGHEKILKEAIKDQMEEILQKKQLRETVRKAIEAQLSNATEYEESNSQLPNSKDTAKGSKSNNKGKKNLDIVKVNQQPDKKSESSHSEVSDKHKIPNIGKPKRRKGKELRRGKRRKLKKRGKRKRKKHRRVPSKRKRRKKNPNLPAKIATTTARTLEDKGNTPKISSTTETITTTVSNTSENIVSSKSNNNTNTIDEITADSEKDEVYSTASGDELSLPDYLRHRGRRQLGGGGGIIQAPLLSACKPGAKRDYNYKCRPKFIPQERNRRDSDDYKDSSPSAPRIKCPKGTRLDPRGQCQKASSLLG